MVIVKLSKITRANYLLNSEYDKVRLVDLDTLFTALFKPCSSVSAALLILILLVGIMVLSLEFIFLLLETSLTTQNKQQ